MRHRDIHVNQSPRRMYALGLVGVAPITREAAKSKCMAVGLLLVAVLGREADGGPGVPGGNSLLLPLNAVLARGDSCCGRRWVERSTKVGGSMGPVRHLRHHTTCLRRNSCVGGASCDSEGNYEGK